MLCFGRPQRAKNTSQSFSGEGEKTNLYAAEMYDLKSAHHENLEEHFLSLKRAFYRLNQRVMHDRSKDIIL